MPSAVPTRVAGASRRGGLRSAEAVACFAALLVCVSLPLAAARGERPSDSPVSPDKLAVTDVRLWSLGDTTRIAIQLTGEFEFETDRLSKPPRIYFDLLGCRLRVTNEKMNLIQVNDGLVKQVRLAQYKTSVTRVVLDLAADLEVNASRLANPDRLIIEVRRTATPLPASATPSAAKPATETTREKARSRRTGADEVEEDLAGTVVLTTKKLPETAVQPVLSAKLIPPPAQAEVVRLAQPAKRNRSGNSSLTRVLGLKLGKIVIDAGHGGHDTGTIGPSGLKEKDVSLDVARRLAALVEDRLGSQVVMTRSDDVSISLESRAQLANSEKADLFLSIHVNSSRFPAANGVEAFYLNFTRSRVDMELAARENAGASKSIHELSDLVQTIAMGDKILESRDFATSLQQVVHQLARKQNPGVRNRGVKKAPFVVLIGARMPSVLVEVGFMTNPAEERLMNKAAHRQKIAEALYEGLAKYAGTLSHFQVAKTATLD